MMQKVLVQKMHFMAEQKWVVMDVIMMVLEGFHHRITGRIMGMTARMGKLVLVKAALEATNIWLIREYGRS